MKKYISCFLLFIGILFVSCGKEESQTSKIPYAQVKIDIQTQLEHEFNNPYYKKIYTTPGISGFGGVIVTSNATGQQLYAYDLCCPYEAPQINVLQVKNDLEVQCPKCKSIYNITDDYNRGRVVSGPGTERLRIYRVFKEGYYYRVRN